MKIKYFDSFGEQREVGEVWIDRAGNECYFRQNGTINVRTINNEESMTVQSERDKCDLNIVKAIYEKTGIMNNVRTDQPRYGDFTASRDYHDLLFRAQQAQHDFMQLDAHIRARFDNDPGKLIDFVNDPNNRAMAIELGLLMAPADGSQASQVPQEPKAPPSPEGG
ncbi:MAG: internal scaffolding protein [Arizlama microvirus]|nr:MAG: internal scaffolding protein [Arizlama microvirus]